MRRAALLLAAVLAAAGCGGEDEPPRPEPTPAAATGDHPGLGVWVAQGCGSCHALATAGSDTDIGPNLGESLKGRDRGYITQKILAPTPGSIMPEDFGERMSDTELQDLVAFLEASAN